MRAPRVSGGAWALIVAIGLIAIALVVVVRPLFHAASDERTAATQAAPPRDARVAPQGARQAPPAAMRDLPAHLPAAPQQIPAAAKPEPPSQGDAEGETAPAADSGEAQAAGDQPTGIALFPPPGTDPPKVGIVVPDGFELPPGYVRHYQVTDDGQALEPILMFHPDFKLLDEKGNPVPMPADRVVPADMAPPGLPIHMLEVPDTEAPLAEAPTGQSGEEPAP